MKLKIFGSNTRVVFKKIPDEIGAVAQFVPLDDLIILDPRSETTFKDFCHEIFHVFWNRTGLHQTNIEPNIEEIMCENFSTFITENFCDIVKFHEKTNKKLVSNKRKTKK